MDITVYLPDEIGKRAKDAGLPFSRLLRDAVTTELAYRDTLAQVTGDMTPHNVDTTNGGVPARPVRLQFTGRDLASDGDLTVYQTDTGTIVVADPEGYSVHDDAAAYGAWLQDPDRNTQGASGEHVLAEAAETLGLPEVIRL